jgi:hypothetical protein
MLSTGDGATITPTALHAQVGAALAAAARAVAIDFEGTASAGPRRLLLVAQGWNARQFQSGITAHLLALGTCSLAEVFATLARATGSREVYLFAHWLPDDATAGALSEAGITLVANPLESIDRAALIADQHHFLWSAARAA